MTKQKKTEQQDTMVTPQWHAILDRLIAQDRAFAIFRLPNEETLRFVMQKDGSPVILNDLEALNEQEGFVIAPFRISDASPLVVIRPDCTSLSEIPDYQLYASEKPATSDEKNELLSEAAVLGFDEEADKTLYQELFEQFHAPLRNGEMMKLVLSRSKRIEKQPSFSPARTFSKAEKMYPRSYVYLFHTPQSGTWLGSTPEMLLTGANDAWHTVALAGTRYPNSDTVTWDDKNLREQHLVTSYILKQLSSFHISPDINGPYTIKAGNLAHLRTDFSFSLPHGGMSGSLLKALHPTPAVSGLPKEEAYQFICDREAHNRLYYSGFLGMLNTEETNIYVNLRCMHIGKKSLTLFAGGGLLASSSLENEWEETEHKLKTMLNIVE